MWRRKYSRGNKTLPHIRPYRYSMSSTYCQRRPTCTQIISLSRLGFFLLLESCYVQLPSANIPQDLFNGKLSLWRNLHPWTDLVTAGREGGWGGGGVENFVRALSLVTVTRMTPRDMVATLSVCLFHSLIVEGGGVGGGGGEQDKSLDRTRITSVICVVSLADYVLTPPPPPRPRHVGVVCFCLPPRGRKKKLKNVIKHMVYISKVVKTGTRVTINWGLKINLKGPCLKMVLSPFSFHP